MKVRFVKMQGAGNDFVLVDELEGEVVPESAKGGFASWASKRRWSIGADGVIFIQKSKKCDAKFLFYNPDGTVAEMDGNGIRCFVKYLHDSGYIDKASISVETLSGQKRLSVTLYNDKVEQVRVDMGSPQVLRGNAQVSGNPGDTFINQPIVVDGVTYHVTSIGMGNPHAVLFVENIKGLDVKGVGAKIRHMLDIFPHGANVHFLEANGPNDFTIRSFERGVEDETLACGTGICASAVAAVLNQRADQHRTLLFRARGGELSVKLDVEKEKIAKVYLIGPAVEVFRGEIEYDSARDFEKAAYGFISNVLHPEG
jgi:diaminopimelate epimerase